jgi:hypothetical protein
MSGSEKLIEPAGDAAGVVCARCEQVNSRKRNLCQACGAHLHVVCHHCGHRNDRASSRCTECNHKLHRSWWKQASRRLFGKEKSVSRLQIILLVLAILIGIGGILFLAELQLPDAEP